MKCIPNAKDSDKNTLPENMLLFHIVISPPDAPLDGTKANLSNHFGHKALREDASNLCILDSCKHITEQPLVLIALERAKCFSGELKPRTFQHNTFQFCKRTIDEKQKQVIKPKPNDPPVPWRAQPQ